jgi:hypothetical protein
MGGRHHGGGMGCGGFGMRGFWKGRQEHEDRSGESM